MMVAMRPRRRSAPSVDEDVAGRPEKSCWVATLLGLLKVGDDSGQETRGFTARHGAMIDGE